MVFAALVVTTYVFTILAEYIVFVRPPQFGRILQTCLDVAKDKKLTWAKDLDMNGRELSEVAPYTGLILALAGMWLFLWLRRGRWVRTLEEAKRPTADRSESETRAAPFQTLTYSKLEWIVGVCVMLISIGLTGVAAYLLNNIMRGRRAMSVAFNGGTGENLWGVGQIAALFVWAPLLVEMGYNAVHSCKTGLAARPPPFIHARHDTSRV